MFLSQVPGTRPSCGKTHMGGYLHVYKLWMSSEELLQTATFDQGDMYMGEEGNLNSNPPGPLRPRSGWVTEVLKVRVSRCWMLPLYHSLSCCVCSGKEANGRSISHSHFFHTRM